jgi:hypothetical protein
MDLVSRPSSAPWQILRRLVALACVAALTATCEHSPTGNRPGELVSITVTPDPDTLRINGTQQFAVVGRDADGNVVRISPAPTWSVVAGGGTVSNTGLFTAGTVLGTYAGTVRASSGTLWGAATVVVIPGPLTTLTVTPDPDTLPIYGTQQFTAVGRDAGGNVVPISPVPPWSVVA